VSTSRYHHKQHTIRGKVLWRSSIPKDFNGSTIQPFPHLLLLVQLGNYGEDYCCSHDSVSLWIFYIITSLGVKGSLPPFKQFKTQRICIRYYTIQIRYTQQQQTHTIPYQDVIPRDIQPPPPSSSYTTPPPPPPS
jgi:hypothetical protein